MDFNLAHLGWRSGRCWMFVSFPTIIIFSCLCNPSWTGWTRLLNPNLNHVIPRIDAQCGISESSSKVTSDSQISHIFCFVLTTLLVARTLVLYRSWSPRLSESRNSTRNSTCFNVCCNFASSSSFTSLHIPATLNTLCWIALDSHYSSRQPPSAQ